jgi:UDP-glucuronate 4-epimerase
MMNEKILVTGSSGFIGMNLCLSLIKDGFEVLGIDNMNNYYDINLKKSRLKFLKKFKNYSFKEIDLSNKKKLMNEFLKFKPEKVVNLAAQAGVRHSLKNPSKYIDSNIVGFMNVLECSREYEIKGLVYASSSSVYGQNTKTPFSVEDRVDKPISIYAVTKRANELMAYSYSNLFNLNTTGLRFFTVYGPWGRPDMAMYIFAKNIENNQPVSIFNHGDMFRDFTYIDDIIYGIRSAINKNYKCEIFNLGNEKSFSVTHMLDLIQNCLNKKAIVEYHDIQLGDVKETIADISYSKKKLGYNPNTSLEEGVSKFIKWYKMYKASKPLS